MTGLMLLKTKYPFAVLTVWMFMYCTNPAPKSPEITKEQNPGLSLEDSVILLLKFMRPVPVQQLEVFSVGGSNEFSANRELDAFCDTTVQLTPDIFYSIISVPDERGVCSYRFILSIDEKNKRKIASSLLAPDCDIDFSQEEYSYYEYRVISKERILLQKITVFNKAGADSDNEEENIERKEIKEGYFTIHNAGGITTPKDW
jgi:hypothetical protein